MATDTYFNFQFLFNELLGDVNLIAILLILVALYIGMRQGMRYESMSLILVVIAGVMYAQYGMIILWAIAATTVGFAIYYMLNKAFNV